MEDRTGSRKDSRWGWARGILQAVWAYAGRTSAAEVSDLPATETLQPSEIVARVRKMLTDKIADLDRRVDENIDDQFEYELCNRTAWNLRSIVARLDAMLRQNG